MQFAKFSSNYFPRICLRINSKLQQILIVMENSRWNGSLGQYDTNQSPIGSIDPSQEQ